MPVVEIFQNESILGIYESQTASIFNHSNQENKTEFKKVKPHISILRFPTWIYTVFSFYFAVMLTINLKRNCNTKRINERYQKNTFGQTLNMSRLFVAHISFIIFAYHSASFLIEDLEGVDCDWFGKAENALYWINVSLIYAVLWLRQRSIYGKPTLKHLTTKMTLMLSNAVGVMVIAMPVLNSAIFSSTVYFKKYEDGACGVYKTSIDFQIISTLEFIAPILLPVTLLGLFAWPLVRHHTSAGLDTTGHNYLIFTVRKISLFTLGCLVTDMGAMACNNVCVIFYSFMGRQTSVFTNLLFLNLSFSDWRAVLLPCVRRKLPSRRKTRVITWTTTSSGAMGTSSKSPTTETTIRNT